MSQPASRLITLIMLLQRQPNQKASTLAEKLGVSVRTLHRYFAALDEMGIPIYSERGPYGGFSLVRGYKMPPLVFTPQEATAVYLGATLVGEVWGSLYDQAAQGALAKLDNVLPDEQLHEVAWARRSLVATGMHRSNLRVLDPLLDMLRHAIRERQRVELLYQGSSDTSRRQVDPYALVYRWGWWYVFGYCHLRQDIRSFRLDRIESISLSGLDFSIPASFDIQDYLAMDWMAQSTVLVRLRFDQQRAKLALLNRAGWEALDEQPDGSVIVSFRTPDLNWAASTVLAYGPLVMVLEPQSLQRLVAEWAQAISKQYLKI